ncbi:MAG: thioredoxin family protein [Bacteroidia bacterium]|nr:thioredoxin family protein [Bacteroidia bacterium]
MQLSDYLNNAYSYPSYRKLLDDLIIENKTTGPDQSADLMEYAKLNLHRMKRLEKTAVLRNDVTEALLKIKNKYTFLVLTEGWCGDAAQNIPLFWLMEKTCANLTLKLILRDENLELMDQYLTNGGRSIPKLICIENTSNNVIFTWGPRPETAQIFVLDAKKKGVDKKEMATELHSWYATDKLQSTQNEFVKLISTFLV